MNLPKRCPSTSLVFYFGWFLCGRVRSPNDVIQKTEKTFNNSNTTKQKGANKSLCNTKKTPTFLN